MPCEGEFELLSVNFPEFYCFIITTKFLEKETKNEDYLQVIICEQSSEKLIPLTAAVCALKGVDSPFTDGIQSLTVLSDDAVAIICPVDENSTSLIASLWPKNLYARADCLKFHTMSSPSADPVAA